MREMKLNELVFALIFNIAKAFVANKTHTHSGDMHFSRTLYKVLHSNVLNLTVHVILYTQSTVNQINSLQILVCIALFLAFALLTA